MSSSLKKRRVKIIGMTCTSCQSRIEDKLNHTAGVVKASVSYAQNEAEIIYDKDIIDILDIACVVENLGYELVFENAKKQPPKTDTLTTLLVIFILYAVLQKFGILNILVPSQLADGNMSYGMLFIIGLVTSVHCLAMCGGINLSQCLPQKTTALVLDSKEISNHSPFMAAVLYNSGRVTAYTLIGFILGLLGSFIAGNQFGGVPLFAQGALKLVAGIFMVIMGLNMLGIFPALRKWPALLPKKLTGQLKQAKFKSRRPFVVGLLNGLMPCGPLQAMQVIALGSGNPMVGALSMFAFSLGTVPLMLGFGAFITVLGRKFTHKIMRIGSLLVVVLGLAMLTQGGSLTGLFSSEFIIETLLGLGFMIFIMDILGQMAPKKGTEKLLWVLTIGMVLIFWRGAQAQTPTASEKAESTLVDGKQLIETTLTAGSFPNIVVESGTPVKWIMHAPKGSINGCNYKMNISEFGITNYAFREGDNPIEFTPTKAGTFAYSCWMGMINGTITVVNGSADKAKEPADTPSQTTVATDGIKRWNSDGTTVNEDTAKLSAAETGVTEASTVETGDAETGVAKSVVKGGVQYVTSHVEAYGYEPISVQAGIPVKWTIIAPKEYLTSCNNAIMAPEYELNLELKEGKNEVEFTPSRSGTFVFSCWMGMVRSDITVTNADGTVDAISDANTSNLPSCCGN